MGCGGRDTAAHSLSLPTAARSRDTSAPPQLRPLRQCLACAYHSTVEARIP